MNYRARNRPEKFCGLEKCMPGVVNLLTNSPTGFSFDWPFETEAICQFSTKWHKVVQNFFSSGSSVHME